jgi:hypothetical protein
MMERWILAALPLTMVLPAAVTAQPSFASPHELIEAVRTRYDGHWHESLTFVQQTVFHRPDGTVDSATWYEALMPGRLRIDVAPIDSGNGALFRDGMRYTIRNHEVVATDSDVNVLALLLTDMFFLDASRSLVLFDSLGFDTTVVHRAEWHGEPVWVVGAERDDLSVNQFWLEADRLLPVRMVQRVGPQGRARLDVRIGEYRKLDRGWIETEVLIYLDGELRQEEHYTNIRSDVELDPGLFDPESWRITEPYWRE